MTGGQRYVLSLMLACGMGCSGETATTAGAVEIVYLHEVATQVTVSEVDQLLRLDGPMVEDRVGGAILLNSEVVAGGAFKEAGLQSTVEGGQVVGTMHGECTTVGGSTRLTTDGQLTSIAKCEQALSFYGKGQVIVSGLIQQDNFEASEPQPLAIIGGSGDFVDARGELIVTQLVLPGIVKQLELRLEPRPGGGRYLPDLAMGTPTVSGASVDAGALPVVPSVPSPTDPQPTAPGPTAGGEPPAVPGPTPAEPTTASSIVERGRYLVHHVAACSECHTPRTLIGQLDENLALSGVECFRDTEPNDDTRGCLHTGNLTNHATGLANRSDLEIKAMFLEGVRPNEKALHPTMPYWVFGNMTEQDADAIVSYLRTVPGIDHMVPPNQPPFDAVAAPEPLWPVEQLPLPRADYPNQQAAMRGRYLAAEVGSCIECHTPRSSGDSPDHGRAFRGGVVYERTALGLPAGLFPDTITTANLTPHSDGIEGWAVQDVVNALKLGKDKDGDSLCPPMPGGMAAFGGLADTDAADIGHYVLSLEPGDGAVVDTCSAPF